MSNSDFRLRLVLWIAVAMGWTIPLSAQTQGSGSIVDAVPLSQHLQDARTFDPNYLAALASRDAAQRALEGSRAQLGPKVSLSVSVTRTERTEETTNFFGQRSEIDRRFESRLNQLQARQPIFRKRELVGVEQAQNQVEASRRTLLSADQDLAMRVVLAWTDILAARANTVTFRGAMRSAQESLLEADRRYKAGDATLQELDQERAKLTQAQALIDDALAQEEIAEQSLKNIVGPKALVEKHYSLLAFTPLQLSISTLEDFLRAVESSNPDIAAARYQEQAALLEREKARADRYPTLDAVASASQGRNDTLPTIKDEQRIGLQLSVPLYTHGAISAAVEQADANYRRAKAQTQATVNKVRIDAITAYGNLRAIQSRVSAIDQVFQATFLTLKAQQAGLKAGISSRAEIAKTTADLYGVARQRVGVRKEQITAWAKAQAVIGGFDNDLLQNLQTRFLRSERSPDEL